MHYIYIIYFWKLSIDDTMIYSVPVISTGYTYECKCVCVRISMHLQNINGINIK